MNDIPTPRTDLAKLQFIYDYSGLCDFTCQIERELATALAKLVETEKERDEAVLTLSAENQIRDKLEVNLRAEIEKKDAALRNIISIRWGYDGDCGAVAIAESALSTNAPGSVAAHPDPTQPWREVVEECATAIKLMQVALNGITAGKGAIARAESLLRKGEVKG